MIATNEVAGMVVRRHLWIGVSRLITEVFVAWLFWANITDWAINRHIKKRVHLACKPS